MVQKDVRRIIYLSSGGTVYGIPEIVPITESHLPKPICSYGVVKLAIENYLFMFQSLYKIEPLIFRVSNPYGERQGHNGIQGIIGTVLQKSLIDEPVVIWGDGAVIRDFIYVSDLAKLCIRALETNECGTFNVGRGEETSIKQVLDCVEKASDRRLCIQYKPARGFDIPQVVLDISRTCATFDWVPTIDLHDGIKLDWEWNSSNGRTV